MELVWHESVHGFADDSNRFLIERDQRGRWKVRWRLRDNSRPGYWEWFNKLADAKAAAKQHVRKEVR